MLSDFESLTLLLRKKEKKIEVSICNKITDLLICSDARMINSSTCSIKHCWRCTTIHEVLKGHGEFPFWQMSQIQNGWGMSSLYSWNNVGYSSWSDGCHYWSVQCSAVTVGIEKQPQRLSMWFMTLLVMYYCFSNNPRSKCEKLSFWLPH